MGWGWGEGWGVTQPTRAAPTSQILPSAWPPAHHPRQNRAELGGGCLPKA